jgi:hypothetical protein
MANKRKELSDEIYQDKIIKCRKCQKVIGEQRMQGQLLILESGLICFNYLCWKCDCNRAASWLAPTLPDEKTEDAPDIADIQTRALNLKNFVERNNYRRKEKQTEKQQQQHFSAS